MSHLDNLLIAAESWLDTPYKHQARVKGVGVDCAQFIAGVIEEVFDKRINIPIYSPEWHMHNREELMCNIVEAEGLNRIELEERQPGDILTFKFGRVNSHLGILISKEEFIHARQDVGKVVKNHLTGDLLARLGRCYRFPDNIINKG